MATLRDKLLDGKVIGETFRTPLTHDTYKVSGLHVGTDASKDYACLIVKESDEKEHHYNLATRLDDIFVQSEQAAQTSIPLDNQAIHQPAHTLPPEITQEL